MPDRPLSAPARETEAHLGAFLGVFTPTVLTILGVILYLRLGWVTGSMGLGTTMVIVVLANLITLVTTLSFSAIATNIRVGVGGAYFMISRSLGLEIGGAIGLPLFLSQVFSVTLYAFGLAESFRILYPALPVQPVAFVVVLAVGALALKGANLAMKTQLPVMGLIGVSLLALVIGVLRAPGEPVIGPVMENPVPTAPFWVAFAVFFPAVTGIMAGLGLSGDLKDPIRAIPRGSLSAVLVGFAVYLFVPVLLDRGASGHLLREDPLAWTRIAPLGAWLIMPGLWGAVFSSAVGSVLGAPRTLQALAHDGLAPRFLAHLAGKEKQPVVGLAVTLGLALAAVLLGDLDAVAPVVTIFFLTVYGMVNLVAAAESLAGDPSWRPKLAVPGLLSLAGGIACFAVMFLISPPAAIAAIVIEGGLYAILARRERREGWGDARRGVYEATVRWALVRLSRRPMTARNWRPHVLVFVDDVVRRLDLVRFATWLSQGRGVVTVCELKTGDMLTSEVSVEQEETRIREALEEEDLIAFGEVCYVRDVVGGILDVSQANGFGGLDSNTILLGWGHDPERRLDILRTIHRLKRLRKSVVIGRIQKTLYPKVHGERVIHIWWGGLQRNSDLMLLLAHLLTRNPEWRHARIQVLSVASNELMKSNTEAYLARLIPEIRIDAEAVVMLKPRDRTVREIIHERSRAADVVFLGLDPPENEAELPAYAERLEDLSEPLRTVFFVKNASGFGGKLVQTPEELVEETGEQPAAKG